MKKYILPALLALVMFALMGVSCRTAPPVAEEVVEPVAVVEQPAVIPEVVEAMGAVDAARTRAMDFEAQAYFPSDWEALEARLAAAGRMPVSNQNEIDELIAELNAVAAAYDDLFRRAVPLFAQAREDEIMAAREQLVRTGFTISFPQFLQRADDLALKALDQYENEEFYEAKSTAAAALSEYETLLRGAKAYVVRREIMDRGFDRFDTENLERADEVADTAIEMYKAGNREGAIRYAEEALLRYNVVLRNGWAAYASERRSSASGERELSIANRVNIAMREDFRAADTIFTQAEADFRAENFERAAVRYVDAEAQFYIARLETEQRRMTALETIRLAEERIEESQEVAAEAERIIEGGLQ